MSLLKLLIVSLTVASAFKVDQSAIKKPALPQKQLVASSNHLLKLRGGGPDVSELAKYAVYLVSGFMFLPAGRDVVAPGAAILPDDDKLMAAMFDDKSKPAYTFMWNAWGINWIMLSVVKILAVTRGNAEFIKVGLVADALAVAAMIKG